VDRWAGAGYYDWDEYAMQIANAIIGGHGVEAIWDNEDDDLAINERLHYGGYGRLVATYVNMGDTYGLTILYDQEENEALFTSMGDWIEAWEMSQAAGQREEVEAEGGGFRVLGAIPRMFGEEPEADEPITEEELYVNVVIQDAERGPGYEAWWHRRRIAGPADWDKVVGEVADWMEDSEFWPSMYYVNERGNVDLLDDKGSIVRSWV
jgi:hypothetical protein